MTSEIAFNRRILVPAIIILALASIPGLFELNPKVINESIMWDNMGRPQEVVMQELNLPKTLHTVLVAGTVENPRQYEDFYYYEAGFAFVNQLRSLIWGTEITPRALAGFINITFGVLAILFSLVAGKFIFNNIYLSAPILLLIATFRYFSQGFIYGLPTKYTTAVFCPLIAGLIFAMVIVGFASKKTIRLWTIPVYLLCGLALGFVEHLRQSEAMILTYSLICIVGLIGSVLVATEREKRKVGIKVLAISLSLFIGLQGYRQMIEGIKQHRDVALNLTPKPNTTFKGSSHPIYHSLFVSLFRFPNEYNRNYNDATAFDFILDHYPEYKEKYGKNYADLAQDESYYDKIKEEYFKYIKNNPKFVATSLLGSAVDYLMVLPYYSWSGDETAYAYLPKIRKDVNIKNEDQPYDFRDHPYQWILNLKLNYLPLNPLFWIYSILAYYLLVQAIYSVGHETLGFLKMTSKPNAMITIAPILLLFCMLVYFSFASIVRILIPNYGHSAVVAFNLIAILNLVRLYSTGKFRAS